MYRSFLITAFLALALFVATIDCNEKSKLKEKRDKFVRKQQAQKRFLLVINTCEANEFRCSSGTCISSDEVCDLHKDCYSGEDEQNCPTDCTGQNQFKCENSNKCIGITDKCDGHADCTDYSDEAFCGSFECPAGRFKCVTSNECIESFFVCDGLEDCKDSSDEKNCHNETCSISGHFECADKGKCIISSYLCDGIVDCYDGSDEKACSCSYNHFKCTNGACIPNSYKCDRENDCGDNSDELDCPALPSNVCRDVLTYEDCSRMNETTHPICLVYADGDKFCRKYCQFCS